MTSGSPGTPTASGRRPSTSPDCATGTDRVHAAVKLMDVRPDAVINLQGDAVLTPPWVVQALVDAFHADPTVGMVTAAVHCSWAQVREIEALKAQSPTSGTLVTMDKFGRALYFSKAIIPYLRHQGSEPPPVHRHIGIYGYSTTVLDQLAQLDQTPLERAEQSSSCARWKTASRSRSSWSTTGAAPMGPSILPRTSLSSKRSSLARVNWSEREAMELLFARHGNTFDPGDRVVWVGRETDLPLVEKGLLQALAAAAALRRTGLVPDIIVAASLRRTRRFAEIIAEDLGLSAPLVDQRLDELDYGCWAGKSNDEIAAEGPAAQAAMDAWAVNDIWPAGVGWVSRETDVLRAIGEFAADRLAPERHRRPLVVSSNGILRFLPRVLLPSAAYRPSFKMRTGHLGIIDRQGGTAKLRGWDIAPPDLI